MDKTFESQGTEVGISRDRKEEVDKEILYPHENMMEYYNNLQG